MKSFILKNNGCEELIFHKIPIVISLIHVNSKLTLNAKKFTLNLQYSNLSASLIFYLPI